MRNLFFILRAPAENDSFGSAMLDAMDEKPEGVADDVSRETPAEDKPKTKFAWGDEDRRKANSQISDDQEIEVGEDEVDGKKVPVKVKISEFKEKAQWFRNNKDIFNAALGMRKEFSNNPDLAKAFNSFWSKAYEGNKYNPEAVSKLNSLLEGKKEDVKEEISEATDDIKEMEALIKELDEDSPQAKILHRNIAGLKATRAQLKTALDTIKVMQDKTTGLDKFKTDFETQQKTSKEEAEAKQANELFKSELGALTSGEKGYKFDDKEDSEEFESLVRDRVASVASSGKITNDAQFKEAIIEAAKFSFEKISRRNEKIVNGYLKKKGQLPKEGEKPKEEDKEKDPTEGKTFGEIIAEGMFGKE